MADDLKISEMQELLTGGLHDDLIFEVVDLTELDVADQNKKVKLVTLEAALGAEDKIFEGDSSVEVIDAGTGQVVVTLDAVQEADFTAAGFKLKTGSRVNEIEAALTNDATHIPDSAAVFAWAAPAAEGVTNGNTHDHNGGDGAQIDHVNLASKGTNTHTQIDSHITATSNPHGVTAAQIGADNIITEINAGTLTIDALRQAFQDKIEEGNSSVEVIDAGTGQVDTTVDTVLILRALVDRYQIPIGLLETNTAAPIDLTVDCGTEKTIKLAQPVWRDLNSSGAQLAGPGVVQPDHEKFLDEAGADTGIYTLAFDIAEKAHSAFEIPHDYVEGSDISFHVHWQGITNPTGTDNVQWELTYTISRDGETLDAVTVIQSPDAPIDTQYDFVRSVFALIDGATGGPNGGSIMIGDQFIFTLGRVAATGDAYLGDALVSTAGIHYMVDTLGSRQIGTK